MATTYPTPKRKLLTKQHPFWDTINSFELPIVVFLQKILFAPKLEKFWNRTAEFGSSKVASYLPLFLYSIGRYEKAYTISASLVSYALLSSLGKLCVKRRRPASYPVVFGPNAASTSSFPSRHSMFATILASVFPFKYLFILFMVCNRIACGQHFLTDCFVGVSIGELSLICGNHLQSPNLITGLLILSLFFWKSGAKVLSGVIPILMAPVVQCNKWLCPIIVCKSLFHRITKKYVPIKTPYEYFAVDLFATSFALYVLLLANQITEYCIENYDVIEKAKNMF